MNKDPFTIELILLNIFHFFETEELRELRLVCQLWNDVLGNEINDKWSKTNQQLQKSQLFHNFGAVWTNEIYLSEIGLLVKINYHDTSQNSKSSTMCFKMQSKENQCGQCGNDFREHKFSINSKRYHIKNLIQFSIPKEFCVDRKRHFVLICSIQQYSKTFSFVQYLPDDKIQFFCVDFTNLIEMAKQYSINTSKTLIDCYCDLNFVKKDQRYFKFVESLDNNLRIETIDEITFSGIFTNDRIIVKKVIINHPLNQLIKNSDRSKTWLQCQRYLVNCDLDVKKVIITDLLNKKVSSYHLIGTIDSITEIPLDLGINHFLMGLNHCFGKCYYVFDLPNQRVRKFLWINDSLFLKFRYYSVSKIKDNIVTIRQDNYYVDMDLNELMFESSFSNRVHYDDIQLIH